MTPTSHVLQIGTRLASVLDVSAVSEHGLDDADRCSLDHANRAHRSAKLSRSATFYYRYGSVAPRSVDWPHRYANIHATFSWMRAPSGIGDWLAAPSCISLTAVSHASSTAKPLYRTGVPTFEPLSKSVAVRYLILRSTSNGYSRGSGRRRDGTCCLQDRLYKARTSRQGMMQQLLTGRTRLPVQETAA